MQPRFVVNITENSAASTLITDRIEARDADTSAKMVIEILWADSYGTKNGQEVDKTYYEGCFKIANRMFNNNLVYGQLKINEAFQSLLDYEKYDTIFLAIKVRDFNQEIKEDSATGNCKYFTKNYLPVNICMPTAFLTIRIDDVNDNAPQFLPGTLKEERSVTELQEIMSTLGTIQAYDIDGIGNNNITFQLR